MKREEKLDYFDVAARCKNRRLRSDADLERDRASYWRSTPVALTSLHGTTEAKCSIDVVEQDQHLSTQCCNKPAGTKAKEQHTSYLLHMAVDRRFALGDWFCTSTVTTLQETN